MIVLFSLALLFVCLAYISGSFLCRILEKIFNSEDLPYNHFQTFLLGFTLTGTYLNAWSLFFKVDFVSIIPIALLCTAICATKNFRLQLSDLRKTLLQLGGRRFLFVMLPCVMLLFLFAIIPPQHGDSGSYHFSSIKWVEEFKVVPGLANLQGRFGFNSSFFVVSAAFSFSSFFDQAIYSINVVLAFAFYAWLLYKIYLNYANAWGVIFIIIAILLFRSILISVSSPTPDIAGTVIVVFLFIDFIERSLKKTKFTTVYVVTQLLIMAFSLTIKLSSGGLLILALLLLLKLKREKKSIFILTVGGVLILTPWVIRNYFLSGYLVYPVSFTGIFSPDWKVPFNILHFDKVLISNGPKLIGSNWEFVDQLPFVKWFPMWIEGHGSNGLTGSLVILIIAAASLLIGLFTAAIKKNYSIFFMFVAIAFGIGFWILNSPDYRFGYSYLVSAIGCFLLYITYNKTFPPLTFTLFNIVLLISSAYYAQRGFRHLSEYSMAKYWLKPMKSDIHRAKQDTSTFIYRNLNEDVKLYIEDPEHNCNLVPLPCFMEFTPSITAENIQLRSKKIEEGFRINKRNNLKVP